MAALRPSTLLLHHSHLQFACVRNTADDVALVWRSCKAQNAQNVLPNVYIGIQGEKVKAGTV